jgi:nicotinate-nucleotide adenylyltransferase
MPLLLALAGLGLCAWNLASGAPAAGVACAIGGIAAAAACMPLRLKRGQRRMVTFGFGALLLLASGIPGLPFPSGVLAWWVAGLALLVPLGACTQQTRSILLGGAGVCALLALLAWRGILPPPLAWLLLAGAFHLGMQVLFSRPATVLPPPVGPTVAVYGGTFDPFHRGHRALVEAAVRQADRVLVVVAGTPPHKQHDAERTAFHHRVAMTRLGVEGLPRVEVLEMEGRRPGPSFTVDTLTALTKSYPAGTRFRLVMGADAFQEFPTWRDWENILELSTLLVASRPGHDLDAPPEFEGRNMPVERLESAEVDASASRLRAVLAEDGDVGDLLSPGVRTYVRDHRLYQPGGAGSGEVELADRQQPRP